MKYAVGIDIGGTFIKYALISSAGDMLYEGKVPTRAAQGREAIMLQLEKAAGLVKDYAAQMRFVLAGIGVGTPGVVDPVEGKVVGSAENLPGWEGAEVAPRLRLKFGLPVWVENDANLMGLGEFAFGACAGSSDVVFLTIGTGVGGAFIINGQLFGGYKGRGGELGHTPLIADGVPCACGAQGCLEAYASTVALIEQYTRAKQEEGVELLPEQRTGEWIVQQYLQGEPAAVTCMDRHCYYIGRAIAGIANVAAPQYVVIGGGISESGDFYIRKIEEVARQHALPVAVQDMKIVAASLGNKAGSMGAAQLVFAHQ